MRWLGAAVAVVLLTACGGGGLEPGDRVGDLRVVRGAAEDVTLWEFCDPELSPERFERACSVPLVDRLRVGPGWRVDSPSALEDQWEELQWSVSLDGRPLELAEFGTLPDTTLADGRVVREWNVTVEGLDAGTHRLRAVVSSGDRRYDMTWVLDVRA
jgi:hypothetical protein